jgi:hypothetical protein
MRSANENLPSSSSSTTAATTATPGIGSASSVQLSSAQRPDKPSSNLIHAQHSMSNPIPMHSVAKGKALETIKSLKSKPRKRKMEAAADDLVQSQPRAVRLNRIIIYCDIKDHFIIS